MHQVGHQVSTNVALCRIESLNCSRCLKEISHTSNNSIWYYYLIQIDGEAEQRETRFVCSPCKSILQQGQGQNQYIPMLQGLHPQLDQIADQDIQNVQISFSQDDSGTRQAPQEVKLIPNQMFCEKCQQNQQTIRDFDIRLKSYVELHTASAIQVAVMLAKEENEKDQKFLSQLRVRLNTTDKKIEKALILNKITNILKKYPQQQ